MLNRHLRAMSLATLLSVVGVCHAQTQAVSLDVIQNYVTVRIRERVERRRRRHISNHQRTERTRTRWRRQPTLPIA